MSYVFESIQTFSVIIILSYLLSRTNFFKTDEYHKKLSTFKFILIVIIFLFISMYGNLTDIIMDRSLYVDTRVCGIALAGLIFGYSASLCVTVPTILISYLSGFGSGTFTADVAIMLLACWLSGFCRNRFPEIDSMLSGIIVGALELTHMLFIVFLIRPLETAKEIVYSVSFPMIVLNGCFVGLFVLVIIDLDTRRVLWQKEGSARSELEIANRIQNSLLPTSFDISPVLDLNAYLEPAKDVGGDLYNFFVSDGHLFKFILGDVSGKGVPAAITMSRTTSLFRVAASNSDSPSEILAELNTALCENNKAQMFVTAVAGTFDLNSGSLRYSNAGHTLSYRVSPLEPAGFLPKPKGMPMGIMPKAKYMEEETVLNLGEYVLFYTDGISEAENNENDQYGNERLEKCLSGASFDNSNTLIQRLISDVKAFTEGAKQSDDIAVFAFGRRSMIISYTFDNVLSELIDVLRKLNSDLEERLVQKELKDNVCIVSEEILTNIVKYGYSDGRKDIISMKAEIKEERIIVEISDKSDSYDQFDFDESEVMNTPARNRLPGKMGIKMVRDRVSDYSYNSSEGINVMKLVINCGEQL